MIDLKNVSIVAVDSKQPHLAAEAINISSLKINFGNKILFSNVKPKNINDTNFVKINNINLHQYNQFIIFNLHEYIKTNFVLIVQHDGFVINPSQWQKEFLNYDYIGASWDQNLVIEKNLKSYSLVGNGGFSLRSKKLLKIMSTMTDYRGQPEDVYFCRTKHHELLKMNIKYATKEVADKFSKENNNKLNNTFGFHGDRNFIHNFFAYI